MRNMGISIYVTFASTMTYILVYVQWAECSIVYFVLYTMYMEFVMITLVTIVNNLLTSLLSYY